MLNSHRNQGRYLGRFATCTFGCCDEFLHEPKMRTKLIRTREKREWKRAWGGH